MSGVHTQYCVNPILRARARARNLTYITFLFWARICPCETVIPYRAAVCMTGSTRSFALPHVHVAFRKRVIDTLKRSATVDIFAVLGLHDSGKEQANWSVEPMETTKKDFHDTMNFIAARKVIVVESHNSTTPNTVGWRSYIQAQHILRCLDMIQEAERQDRRLYTHVIRTRPDLFWYGEHFDLALLSTPNTTFWHPAGPPWGSSTFSFLDWHFVLSRSEGDILRTLASFRPDSRGAEANLLNHGMEHLLEQIARNKASLSGHSWQRIWPFPVVLVRTSRDQQSVSFICHCADIWTWRAMKADKLPPKTPRGLGICDLAYPHPLAIEEDSEPCPVSCLEKKILKLQIALRSQLGAYPVYTPGPDCPIPCLEHKIGSLRAALHISRN